MFFWRVGHILGEVEHKPKKRMQAPCPHPLLHFYSRSISAISDAARSLPFWMQAPIPTP